MRQPVSVLLLLTPLACAQVMVPPGQLAGVRLNLEPRPGDRQLRCDVTPINPIVNFAFRFEAGYAFHVPQSQYSGNTSWSVIAQITPEHGAPSYLIDRTPLSQASRIGLNFEIRGAYMLGVGRYTVDATLRDDGNRVCRKQWPVVVMPSHANRAIPLSIAPGSVLQLSPFVPPSGTKLQDNAAPVRLTLMLNAAAFSMYRTTIRPYDRSVLMGALTSLMEHLPATSVRMVAFSLEQQREIFRAENFTISDVAKVATAVRRLDEATVDVHILQKPQGHVDFLAALIGHELGESNPADTVIFLGPTSRYGPNIPKGLLPPEPEGSPRFFYVRYGVPRRPSPPIDTGIPSASDRGGKSGGSGGTAGDGGGSGGSGDEGGGGRGGGGGGGRHGGGLGGPSSQPTEGQSDIITAAVDRLKGRTIIIHTPADLAKAIRKIEGKR